MADSYKGRGRTTPLINMSLENSSAYEPLQMYDNELHAVISRRRVSRVQDRILFQGVAGHRPDLSLLERQTWLRKISAAERLKQVMAYEISKRIVDYESLVFATSHKAIEPLGSQLRLMRFDRTNAHNFNPGLSLQEYNNMANWYDRIENRIRKYELRYPFRDSEKPYQQFRCEPERVAQRQRAVQETMMKEMGIDYSLFDGK